MTAMAAKMKELPSGSLVLRVAAGAADRVPGNLAQLPSQASGSRRRSDRRSPLLLWKAALDAT
jgi:hypothetical protein